jgi:hypothetical protein
MTGEQRNAKNLKRSGHGITNAISFKMPGGTE